MFPNKNNFFVIVFFFCASFLFAQKNNIRTLSLSFSRTETSNSGESFSIQGSIVFRNSPFLFCFNTISPLEQTSFVNTDGSFTYIDRVLYDYSESEETMMQTCSDFLNWFKSDFGLSEQGYFVSECKKENEYIVSTWLYKDISISPYKKIIAYSDKNALFIKMMMYDKNDELVSESQFFDYEKINSFSVPKKILINNYKDNKIILTTEFCFSNIKINKTISKEEYKQFFGNAYFVELPNINKIQNQVFTQESSFTNNLKTDVSSFSLLVNTGFSFYKKFITSQDNSDCAFFPSCSVYMKEAIEKNGMFGFIQGLERLKRCTKAEHSRNIYPLTKENKQYDPVN